MPRATWTCETCGRSYPGPAGQAEAEACEARHGEVLEAFPPGTWPAEPWSIIPVLPGDPTISLMASCREAGRFSIDGSGDWGRGAVYAGPRDPGGFPRGAASRAVACVNACAGIAEPALARVFLDRVLAVARDGDAQSSASVLGLAASLGLDTLAPLATWTGESPRSAEPPVSLPGDPGLPPFLAALETWVQGLILVEKSRYRVGDPDAAQARLVQGREAAQVAYEALGQGFAARVDDLETRLRAEMDARETRLRANTEAASPPAGPCSTEEPGPPGPGGVDPAHLATIMDGARAIVERGSLATIHGWRGWVAHLQAEVGSLVRHAEMLSDLDPGRGVTWVVPGPGSIPPSFQARSAVMRIAVLCVLTGVDLEGALRAHPVTRAVSDAIAARSRGTPGTDPA